MKQSGKRAVGADDYSATVERGNKNSQPPGKTGEGMSSSKRPQANPKLKSGSEMKSSPRPKANPRSQAVPKKPSKPRYV